MKLNFYATKKSLIVVLKMKIKNHETIILLNNKLINRITIKLI